MLLVSASFLKKRAQLIILAVASLGCRRLILSRLSLEVSSQSSKMILWLVILAAAHACSMKEMRIWPSNRTDFSLDKNSF